MNSSSCAIVASDQFIRHITPPGHPESPKRTQVIQKALKDSTVALQWYEPRLATVEELHLCHTEQYIERVKKEVAALSKTASRVPVCLLSTGDVTICPDSFEIASLAGGGVLCAVDAVEQKKVQNAFCVVRPPGHHACSDRGMGFCLFNNVAIGARYVQKKYKIERVLIVDWDLHHGNGTQEIFYDDPSVFYFSTHQQGIYPGTGFEEERGKYNTIMNCPIAAGEGSVEAIFAAFTQKLVPAMHHFQPQFVFISCGFDAHIKDPLGHLAMQDEHFFQLTMLVKEIAHRFANDRLVSVLEGGYNLEALISSSKMHIQALTKL